MATSRKRGVTTTERDEQALRDQEVLRATKELAAYVKGARTEREARAAMQATSRRPLPGAPAGHANPNSLKKAAKRPRPVKGKGRLAVTPASADQEAALAHDPEDNR